MNKAILLISMLLHFQNVVGQSQFLKEMQKHTNIYEQGVLNESTEEDSIQISREDYNELMQESRVLMESGNFRKSIELLKLAKNIYKSSIDQSVGSLKTITQRNPYPYYYQGLNFMFMEKTDSALHYFEEAINEAPFFSDSYNAIGNIFLKEELVDSALTYFEKALSFDPKSPISNHNIGLIYLIKEDPDQAKKYFLKNIGVNPEFAPSYILAADIFEENQSFHMAEIFYSKAITLNENKFDFLIARGYYYLRRKENYRAYIDFKSAESFDNLEYYELWQVALIELENDQYLAGMDYVDKMKNFDSIVKQEVEFKTYGYLDIEIASLLFMYLNNETELYEKEILGRLLSEVFFDKKNGTYTEANKLLKLYPDSEMVNRVSIYAKARLYLKREEVSYQLVNNFLSKVDAVLEDFEHPELYLLKAQVLEKYGANDDALVEIEKLIKLNNRYAIAFLYRGIIYYESKQYDEAIESLNEALRLEPGFIKAQNARAMTYMSQQKYALAMENFTSIIELDRHNWWPYNGLAICYKKTGLVDSALVYFNKSLEINPNLISPLKNRGDLFFDKGQYERALLDYNRVIELNQEYGPAREKRGDILFRMGQLQPAIDDYLSVLHFYQQDKFKFSYRGEAYLLVRKYLNANEQLIDMFRMLNDLGSVEKYKRIENDLLSEYSENYTTLGAVVLHKGELEESKKRFEIALEFNPTNYKAQHYFAFATLCLGDVGESIRLYEKFKKKANQESIDDAIFVLEKVDSSDPQKKQVQSIIDDILID